MSTSFRERSYGAPVFVLATAYCIGRAAAFSRHATTQSRGSLAATGSFNRWVPVSRKELSRALRVAMPEKEAVVISKAAQEFIKEGERRGRKAGWKEATLGTEAKILLRQLSLKFGSVPERIEKRVRGASLGQLETWLDRFVEARAMEDVFL